MHATTPTILTRPRRVVIGGVCAGLAAHLGWPLGRVRALMVLAGLLGGAGVLFYLWLWALTPLAAPGESARASDSEAGEGADLGSHFFGGDSSGTHSGRDSFGADAGVRRAFPGAAVLVSLAALAALVAAVVPQSNLPTALVPGILETILLGVAAVAWSLGLDRRDPGRSSQYGTVVRAAAAGLMIALGIILLLKSPAALTAVLAVLLIVLGSAVLFIPRVVALWSEVIAERAGRVREEQRAEIAAHLHDSVLQTLALIQNRAGASSEVARLARAQERELRDWLFAGTGAVSEDLATELREVAAAIELEYPVRLDVVTAGGATVASAAIVAAAREAMLNAARHVGGDVSVYLETSPLATDVFVRDRGPGFDLAALPSDRLGIRESIIGRMSRAGGTATVGPGAGGVGTEVHLHLEAQP